MQARTGFVVSLSLVAFFLNGCGAVRQLTDTPTVAVLQSLVAIRDAGILRLIDPMTGTERLRVGNREASLGLTNGSGDTIFASITTADGASTEIHAISLRDRTTERIGTLPGSAYAKRVSPDGAHLYLLAYARSGDASAPDRVLDLPIPDRWRGTARNVPSPVAGGSALTLDGATWYRVDGTALERGEQATGGSPIVSRLPLPAPDVFTSSLLMSPDGRTLYVIDYRYGENIYVVDVAQRGLWWTPLSRHWNESFLSRDAVRSTVYSAQRCISQGPDWSTAKKRGRASVPRSSHVCRPHDLRMAWPSRHCANAGVPGFDGLAVGATLSLIHI